MKKTKHIFNILLLIAIYAYALHYTLIYSKNINQLNQNDLNKANNDTALNTKNNIPLHINNIVFIGDSITEGYLLFNKIDSFNVIEMKGLSAKQMMNKELNYQGTSVLIKDIVPKLNPTYFYIGFGMNDISENPEDFYQYYKQNILNIMKLTDSKIILPSITPTCFFDDTNYKIQALNEKIQLIASELGNKVYYLDIYNILCDENGHLNKKYNSGDNVHINSEGYDILIKYLEENHLI